MTPKRTIYLGKFLGLEFHAAPSVLVTIIVAVTAFFLFLNKVLKWRPWTAVTGGILATALHYLSELWHQLGHARAAEQTGFPMKGVTLVGPLGVSVYPKNEGLLSADVHIQRALGGPIFSLLLSLGAGLIAFLMQYLGGLPLFLAVFSFLDNLFFFTIGAFMPLGFTDGSTLRTWWSQRQSMRLSL